MNFFLDFEANSPTNEIISIGCISETGDSFYSLIKPSTPLDGYVKKITHLHDSDFEDARTLNEVMFEFMCWIRMQNSNYTWKDLNFYVYGDSDKKFLEASLNLMENDYLNMYEKIAALATRIIDYSPQVRKFFTQSNQISLASAVNFFRSDDNIWEQQHNSLNDAEALKELYDNTYNKPPIDVVFSSGRKIQSDNKTFNSLDDAVNYCLSFVPRKNRNEKTKKTIEKNLRKAIKSKQKYCGIRWRYVDE